MSKYLDNLFILLVRSLVDAVSWMQDLNSDIIDYTYREIIPECIHSRRDQFNLWRRPNVPRVKTEKCTRAHKYIQVPFQAEFVFVKIQFVLVMTAFL